jgi:ribosomal protein L7/L12
VTPGRRPARVGRRPDLVLGHSGPREEAPRRDEVASLAGRGTEAIKGCRKATGAGLKEAEEAVDRLTP